MYDSVKSVDFDQFLTPSVLFWGKGARIDFVIYQFDLSTSTFNNQRCTNAL